MLSAQVEPYADVIDEMLPLMRLEWDEAALDRDRPEAAMRLDLPRYAAMDAMGMVVVVTLREGPRLAGYLTLLLSPALHFSACLTAHHDLLFVLPEFRGRLGGLRLLRAAKRELQRRGVHRWLMGSTIANPADRLYAAVGFTPAETYYSMWLGGPPTP